MTDPRGAGPDAGRRSQQSESTNQTARSGACQPRLNRECLAVGELAIPLHRQVRGGERSTGTHRWLIHGLIRELERPPMDGHHQLRAKPAECLNRFRGMHVEIAHEPAWLVRADGQECEIERTAALGDSRKLRMVAGVAREENTAAIVRGERPAAPQRFAAIDERATAEVLRRYARDVQVIDVRGLPPVQLAREFCSAPAHKGFESQRNEPRRLWKRARERPNRTVIEMIVVVVRLQNDVDGRQVAELYTGCHPTTRTGKAKWRRAITPHRVGEDVQPAELQ